MKYRSDEHAEVVTPEVPETADQESTGVLSDEETLDDSDGEVLDPDSGEDEGLDDDGEHADDDEPEDTEEVGSAQFSEEQQKVFDRAMSRKQKKLRDARSKLEATETELAAIKSERDALNAKVGDNTILSGMQAAGVLPEYITASEAKIVGEAESLKAARRFLKQLVRQGDEYTGLDAYGNERTWDVDQLAGQLDHTEDRLEQIGGKAAAIRERIVEEYRTDCKAGRAVRKQGGKPRASATAKPRRAKPAVTTAPPAPPASTGAQRNNPAHQNKKGVDWSKVSTREELKEALEAEERATQRRG